VDPDNVFELGHLADAVDVINNLYVSLSSRVGDVRIV
jgi:hypothetical protein